jgi:hypothetical protein
MILRVWRVLSWNTARKPNCKTEYFILQFYSSVLHQPFFEPKTHFQKDELQVFGSAFYRLYVRDALSPPNGREHIQRSMA